MPVTGAAGLRVGAARMRQAPRDISRAVRGARSSAAKPLQRDVKASAATLLPKAGGYAAIMSRAVKVATQARAKQLTLRIYAAGKTELRDVVTVNAGILRHPVYGRRSRWKTTHVVRGFVDKPIDRFAARLNKETQDAIDGVLERT